VELDVTEEAGEGGVPGGSTEGVGGAFGSPLVDLFTQPFSGAGT